MTFDFLAFYGDGERLFGETVRQHLDEGPEGAHSRLGDLMSQRGSDKAIWHNYPPFYEKLLRLIPQPLSTVLEVGIGSNDPAVGGNMGIDGVPGASLRAWRDYLPEAMIYGADWDTNCLFTERNISTFYLDQNNSDTINHAWSIMPHLRFDLVVDDGAHNFRANSTLLDATFCRINPGGLHIIEDIVLTLGNLTLFDDYFSARGWPAVMLRLPFAANAVDNVVAVVCPHPVAV